MRGRRVKVISITSPHGVRLESLEAEMESATIGRVETDPDPVGWVKVKFPTCDAPLDVPAVCLQVVRSW